MGIVMAALQIGMLFHDFAEVAPHTLLVFALVGAGSDAFAIWTRGGDVWTNRFE
jgi:F0F1-type ATP synthase assembly protein I